MARLLTEGFETYDFSQFWNVTQLNGSAWAAGRINGNCRAHTNLTFRLEENTEFFARFAYIGHSGNAPRFQAMDANSALALQVNWAYVPNTPLVSFYLQGQQQPAATAEVAIPTGWSVFEVHFRYTASAMSGNIELKRNGVTILAYGGATKMPAGADDLGFLVFGLGTGTYPNYLDDIAVNDTSPGVDDSWCGDGHVVGIRPNANGDASQFVGSDGNSVDNYLLVDEAPPNTTDFVESDVSGNKDLYQATNVTLKPNDTVQRVWMWAYARELAAESDAMQLGFKLGGTEYWGTGIPLGIDWLGYVGAEYLTNPATSAVWTQTDINNAQIGVKVP